MNIRAALVGCGRISRRHLEAIQGLSSKISLVAVCDIDIERAREVAASLFLPEAAAVCTELSAMLAEFKPEILIVATPSGLHPQHAIAGLDAGCHVICEKPMATRLDDAHRMLEAAKKNDKRLFVVHQNRLNTTIQLLKRAIERGRFGKIYMIQVNVFWQRPQTYYDQAPWRGTWQYDGGAFLNQSSHYVDLLDYLVGGVERLYAYTGTLARKIEAEDSGVVSMRFLNGALGTMNVTMLTYPHNYEGSITIIGEKGTVKIGGIAVNKIEKWEFSEYDDDDRLVLDSSYETKSVYGYGHSGYYTNVIQSLAGKPSGHVCERDGLRSLQLILAIYQSASSGREVVLQSVT
jgi:UDP-N-acetyl-2-amino-2-deoxyglucuronate dehydrogenase